MAGFRTSLVVDIIGKNKFQVVSRLIYKSDRYQWKGEIVVPVGFITNFASVPRPLWPIIGPIDRHAKAATLHDYLYSIQECSRIEADRVFKEALKACKVKPWKVKAMYYAVRLFGWSCWGKYKKLFEDLF